MQSSGFDLGDGLRRLLDLRFADDVVFFARTQTEAAHLLDLLVEELAKVGLQLNESKTVALTTESQPPAFCTHPMARPSNELTLTSGLAASSSSVVTMRHLHIIWLLQRELCTQIYGYGKITAFR